jgi:hypothetical protein
VFLRKQNLISVSRNVVLVTTYTDEWEDMYPPFLHFMHNQHTKLQQNCLFFGHYSSSYFFT